MAVSSGVGCGGKGATTPRADGSMNGSGGAPGRDAGPDTRDGNASAPDGNTNVPDANVSDANVPDANATVPDAGLPDANANVPDASLPDANATVPDANAADANRDVPSEAGAPDGAMDRAPLPDAPAADGRADRTPDLVADGPNDLGSDITGGPGCGADTLCWNLRAAYSEAIIRAKSCSSGNAACSAKAAGSLGCLGGCQVWVNSTAELDPISERFSANRCGACFYGSPTGDRCHPVVCNDLGTPMCMAGPSGQGTCVNTPKDRACKAGVTTGTACTPQDDYCTGFLGKFCTCTRPGLTWLC